MNTDRWIRLAATVAVMLSTVGALGTRSLSTGTSFALTLLPSGRVTSPHTRRIGRIVLVTAAAATASAMFPQELLSEELARPLTNPLGVLPYSDVERSLVVGAIVYLLVAIVPSAVLDTDSDLLVAAATLEAAGVVAATVQPAHVSLWIPDGGAER